MKNITQIRRESFEGLELVFMGDQLVGTAESIDAIMSHGVSIGQHEGVPIGYKDGVFYSLCGVGLKAFKVGTKCRRTDVHYVPETKMAYLEALAGHYDRLMPCGENSIVTPVGIKQFTPGRGEWTARTEGDALEMAVAFSREIQLVTLARAIAYNSGHSNIFNSYRSVPAQDAIHRLPKRISMIYEEGMVLTDRSGDSILSSYGIVDGSEICIRYKASKKIGRFMAIRGELDSHFTTKVSDIQVSTPITLTLPLDYPVFVG